MCVIVRTRITKAVTPQRNDWPLMVQKVFALFTLQFILKNGEPAELEVNGSDFVVEDVSFQSFAMRVRKQTILLGEMKAD